MSHPSAWNPLGTPFIELQSVDSTNNYALEQIHAGLAQHGAAIFAHEQVKGKGQRGKNWSSGRDTSVILSMIVKPQLLSISQQFQLSACAAVSVYEFFSHYAGDNTSIKWPNDIYWQDRKAGGILIESIIGNKKPETTTQQSFPDWLWAVIGIGININQRSFPEELRNPVSLRQITGKEFNPLDLAREICMVTDKNLNILLSGGFKKIHSQYNNNLYKKNQPVKLKKDNRVFEALIKGVSETGMLLTSNTIDEEFNFGEIEWLVS